MSYVDHKETKSIFGNDYKGRKEIPIYSYLTRYFPKALVAIVNVCVAGNRQHNKDLPATDIHWAREKSTDQLNTAMRHIMDHGTMGPLDDDGQYHLAKAAWRIQAELELQIERDIAEFEPIPIKEMPVDIQKLISRRCQCGLVRFNYFVGDLAPNVIKDGQTHNTVKCV